MFEPSTFSAEGSQSFSLMRVAGARGRAPGRLSGGLGLALAGAGEVAVERADQIEGEALGAVEGLGVDRRGDVLGGVVVGGGDRSGLEAGDGARAQAADAGGERVGRESVAKRARRGSELPSAAVGLGDRLAELRNAAHPSRTRS